MNLEQSKLTVNGTFNGYGGLRWEKAICSQGGVVNSTVSCFFRLVISVKLQPMQNHVAVAVHLALTGDETRMKTMIIGGAGASPCRLR